MNFLTHIERYHEASNSYIEKEYLVEFEYTPPHKGDRGSYGEPLSPDECEEVNITDITLKGIRQDDMENDGDLIEDLEQQAWDYLALLRSEY